MILLCVPGHQRWSGRNTNRDQTMNRHTDPPRRNVRMILEARGLLPLLNLTAVPRDEQLPLAPPGTCLFLLLGFDEHIAARILQDVNKLIAQDEPSRDLVLVNDGCVDCWNKFPPPLDDSRRVLFHLPESYFEIDENGHWPLHKVLPTHIFTRQATMNARVTRFLQDHEDVVIHHAFALDCPVETVGRDVHFLLENATVEMLDNRRMTWISKEEAPFYCSKALRRGNTDPYDKTFAADIISLSPEILDRYCTLRESLRDSFNSFF